MFKFPKKIFIELSTSVVNVCKHPQCVSLSNQKCTTQPILVNLHPMNTVRDYSTIHFMLIKIDL